jgi:hypothetical protein
MIWFREMKLLHIIISRNEKKSGQEKTAEKSWTVGVQLQRTIIRLLFCLLAAT